MYTKQELLKIIRDYTEAGITEEEKLQLVSEPYTISSQQTSEREYNALLQRISMGIKGGKGLQQTRTEIYHRDLAIKILNLFGFYQSSIPFAHKLLKQATTHHQHQIAASLSRLLAKHYAIYVGKMDIAEKFQAQAVLHHDIYGREIMYDWSYQKIRARFSTDEFRESAKEIKDVLRRIEPYRTESIRLMFIHYELSFFLCYLADNIPAQKEACIEAIAAFNELPYSHDFTVNIFSIHLIDILIRDNDLAAAELVIINRLEDQVDLGSHEFRFRSLLLSVSIKKGDILAAREILDQLQESPKFLVYENTILDLEAALVHMEGKTSGERAPKEKNKQKE